MTDSRSWRLDSAAADFYERHFVPAIFAEWARLLVRSAGIEAGHHVLDVACGTGAVARVAADRVGESGRVVGVDLNASMLEVARRVRPDITWSEGEAAALPFGDCSFDRVLCQAALMFFPDRVAALREMKRVLRQSGVAAVQVFGESAGYDEAAELLAAVAGRDVAEIFLAPFALSDPHEVTPLFAEAGFGTVDLETHVGTARYPSLETFVRTEIDGWVLAGQVDVAELLEAARREPLSFVASDGSVRIPLEGHVVTASG